LGSMSGFDSAATFDPFSNPDWEPFEPFEPFELFEPLD
jgi:hypothetical protein